MHEIATRITINDKGECQVEVDRIGALNSLGKMLGVFVNRTELTGANGGPVELESLSDREVYRNLLTSSVGLFKGVGLPPALIDDLSVAIDDLYPEVGSADGEVTAASYQPGRFRGGE
jgi:hypothetical protein